MLCALGCPLPAALSSRRPGAVQPRTQPPKVTRLFLGLYLCQQEQEHARERALGEVLLREGPLCPPPVPSPGQELRR